MPLTLKFYFGIPQEYQVLKRNKKIERIQNIFITPFTFKQTISQVGAVSGICLHFKNHIQRRELQKMLKTILTPGYKDCG